VSCEEQGLITCFDGSCAASEEECAECPAGTVADCSGDGDCGYETWVGDGYCDGVAQQYGVNNCCYDNDGGDCTEEECTEGRAQASVTLKKDSIVSLSNGRTVDVIRTAKQSAMSLRDGIMIDNTANGVRLGEVISNSSREVLASITFEVLEGTNAGFSQSWDTDPALGEFTVYGFGADDFVCAHIVLCDAGACSETVSPGCVMAGSDMSECDEGSGCDNAAGDVNGDGNSDVLDIVQIVNVILGGSFSDDCSAEAADINGDGGTDVLDIVQIVNMILGGRSDFGDATQAKLIKENGALVLNANGYVGGVQMTLSHNLDFSIELTDDAMVADYSTIGGQTTLVIVVPGSDELFTYSGDFEVVEVIIANSTSAINVNSTPSEFKFADAYPNPFNPVTNLTLDIPEAGHVSVQVYNVMGQVVETLENGYMEATTTENPHFMKWDASNVSSGVYFVKAEAAGVVTTQKLMLLK